MQLSEQVCTLEQAKKFLELGITKSRFYWGDSKPFYSGMSVHLAERPNKLFDNEYPAFTLSELMQMLPDNYAIWYDGDVWHCSDSVDNAFHMVGATAASAAAEELLSTIKDDNLITPEEVNNRLQSK